MPEDTIATALRAVEPSRMIPTEPGTVALLCERIESEAIVDPVAVAAWVASVGGYLSRTEPVRSRSLSRRYGQVVIPAADFYVVPESALTGAP